MPNTVLKKNNNVGPSTKKYLTCTVFRGSGCEKMTGSHVVVLLMAATSATAQIFRLPEQEACENSKLLDWSLL
jgi:hypothetical protein